METRVIELYIGYTGTLDDNEIHNKVYTNAPDEVIKSICEDVRRDGVLKRGKALDGIVNIIKARGFICEYANISRFGFNEKDI